MGRKKILEKRLARLQARKNKLMERSQAENISVEELRSIQTTIADITEDITETEEEISELPDDGEGQARSADPVPPSSGETVQTRGGNPMAAYHVGGGTGNEGERREEAPYSSLEYRQAFMSLVQRGTPIPHEVMTRAGGDAGTTVTADIGAIIPETIMREFIKEVSKVYGNIYAKVRKLNVQGGVKFPISKLKGNFKWITETTVSEKQKAGDIKDFVVFNYNIGEIRVAESLLSQVVSLSLFESEITRIMVEAYVETMDKVIISGSGEGQPLGITKDTRVKNVVEFTEEEFADWTAWRKKLFAVVPLSKRGQGEFLFPASTVESYLRTMKDNNNRPLYTEAADLSIGNRDGRFFGRNVDLVEPDVVADFGTAAAGDVIGVFWVPNDYALNTNMQFGMKRYYDDDNNEWINKGLTIVDGKILDPSGCYLIKKKAASAG